MPDWLYVVIVLIPAGIVWYVFIKDFIRHIKGDCDGC